MRKVLEVFESKFLKRVISLYCKLTETSYSGHNNSTAVFRILVATEKKIQF